MKPIVGQLWMVGVVLVCSCLVDSPSIYGQGKAKKVVSVEGITEYKLPNGFRYLLFPDDSSPKVTVNVTILVGSRQEGYGETGMAHLLEHMVFKGSPKFLNPKKALNERGATYNGTTFVDRTNYFETLPASDENLEFAIEFEADRLTRSFIKREDLAKEMTVVRNEFEQGENNPVRILFQRVLSTAFEWHNYGKSTIGNRADIERVPVENLQVFYKKYYQPDNMVLVVAGKFNETKAHQYIAKYFGSLPKPKRELPKTYTEEPPQDGERTVTLRRNGKIGAVIVAYHIPSAAHPDCAATQVLAQALTNRPSGRYYKALVEKKKAIVVGANAFAWHDPSVMLFIAIAAPGTKATELRELLVQELDETVKKPLTEKEIARAKNEIIAARERLLTKPSQVAVELSEWLGAGDWRLMFIHRDRIKNMTAKQVNQVAKKYLKPSNRTVGVFVPTDPKEIDRSQIPETPDIAQLVKEYKGGEKLAQGEKFDPTPDNLEKRIQRGKLRAGLKYAVLPKKTRGETVVLRMRLRFGNQKSLMKYKTAAQFLGSLMERGTKKYSYADLQDKLSELQSTLSVSSSPGTLNVTISSKGDKLSKTLDLLEEILRRPTFPEKELDLILRSTVQSYKQAQTDPSTRAANLLTRTLTPYPKDDIRYNPTIAESLEMVKGVEIEQLVELYKTHLGGTTGELAIVGDFDVKKTLVQIEDMLAGWKSKIPYKRIPNKLFENVQGDVLTIQIPDKKNAMYMAGYLFPMSDSSPKYPAMRLANYLLGEMPLNSLISNKLREELGISYGAGSFVAFQSIDKVANFMIQASFNPMYLKKVDDNVIDLLKQTKKNGISQTLLQEAKEGYLQNRQLRRANDSTLASALVSGLYLGRTFDRAKEVESKIADLTVSDVNEALKELIKVNRLVIVRAGDFQKKKSEKK
ncbi:MAG: M16 family metallopeptidase [Gemmataceae bacterium]